MFADLAAFNFDYAKLRVGNQTQRTNGESVSTNYFEVLGVAPVLGRTFAAKESERSSSPVIILSDRLWRSRFAADPQILGRRIALDNGRLGGRGRDYTVIGVMGPEFAGVSNPWQPAQYWVPVVQRIVDTELWCEPEHIAPGASVIVGRLKPGVTTAQARALIAVQGIEVHQLQRQRARRDYDSDLVLSVAESRRFGLPFDPRGDVMPRRFAAALIALSAIVMLIAIANLAGLLMARGLTRRAEIAVRMTLGASRWRIVRQLLSESMLLAILGGIAGVLLARVLIGLFVAHTPGEFGFRIPTQVVLDVPIDTRVLLFTTLVCIATGFLVGLVPARQAANANLLSDLGTATIAAPRQARSRLRWILIPQVCLSLVLLLVAGTLVRTLLRSELTDPGYSPDGLVSVEYELPWLARCDSDSRDRIKAALAERDRFQQRLFTTAKSLPATDVGVTLFPPFDRGVSTGIVSRQDFARGGPHHWITRWDITPGYLGTLKIPLLFGRDFGMNEASDRSVIVSESLARMLWPEKNPVGETLALHDPKSTSAPQWREVVGVVKDVRQALSEGERNPAVYVPFKQIIQLGSVVARGHGTPAELIKLLRKVVADASPDAEVVRARTVTDAIAEIRYPRRIAAAVVTISGLLGLLLAIVGLYGVVSYSVAQRLREIGIRAALGAKERDIMSLVIADGFKVLVIGAVLGCVLALSAVRVTSRMVVEMPGIDLEASAAVVLLLAASILLACYIPARRASRVDPMLVLRSE